MGIALIGKVCGDHPKQKMNRIFWLGQIEALGINQKYHILMQSHNLTEVQSGFSTI
jgi:hypothetical protein